MNKKCLLLSSLLTAVLCLGATSAKAETYGKSVDKLTDWIFYRANPELNDRKLNSREYGYIAEWNAIRESTEDEIDYKVLECAQDKPAAYLRSYDAYPHYGYKGNLYRSTALDRIADRIFYQRNPEYRGQPIGKNDVTASRNWQTLRKQISLTDPCD
jgi:hypothetical protein